MRSGRPFYIYTQPIPVATFTRDLQTGELKGDNLVVSRVPAVALVHQESDYIKPGKEDSTEENSANRMNKRSYTILLFMMVIIITLELYI